MIKFSKRLVSNIETLPLLKTVSPSQSSFMDQDSLDGFLRSQRLALSAAREVGGLLREGWTEQQAASMLNTYLQDMGVRHFFHYGFAWFGDRTRFADVKGIPGFLPSKRVLCEGDAVILDVAPIVDGYVSDIGYSCSLGQNEELEHGLDTLRELRPLIPKWFEESGSGAEVWQKAADFIKGENYEVMHQKYPFAVLGHRVHKVPKKGLKVRAINFGWQSYWSLLSRGLFGQLLNQDHVGGTVGIWAIEPHIGGVGFGAKFEEILVVTSERAYWLEQDIKQASIN